MCGISSALNIINANLTHLLLGLLFFVYYVLDSFKSIIPNI